MTSIEERKCLLALEFNEPKFSYSISLASALRLIFYKPAKPRLIFAFFMHK